MLWLEPGTENYVKEITSELGTERKCQKSRHNVAELHDYPLTLSKNTEHDRK